MCNIINYVRQMKDVPFEIEPLNEVDSLIFSQLAYLDYTILDEKELCFFSEITDSHLIQRLVNRTWNPENNIQLFSEVSKSKRYGSTKILNQVSLLCEQEEQQFSAVTFELADHVYYIAYRGTNSTFAGWKEDLNMSYLKIIPSQESALNYFKAIHKKEAGKYYLGGHSKGGNLAVFAGVFSSDEEKNDIVDVYNHDGPGLHKSLKDSVKYKKMSNKIKKIVPEASVVGILLEEEQDFSVVKSNAWTIMQHDPYTWIVDGMSFIRVPSTTWLSNFTQRTIHSWINTMDEETKRTCLASLYTITRSMDTPYFSDAVNLWPKNVKLVFFGIKSTNKEVRKKWRFAAKTLVKTSLQEGIPSRKISHMEND